MTDIIERLKAPAPITIETINDAITEIEEVRGHSEMWYSFSIWLYGKGRRGEIPSNVDFPELFHRWEAEVSEQ